LSNTVRFLRLAGLLRKLTDSQKAALLSGPDEGFIEGADSVGIPGARVAPGCCGLVSDERATCFPSPSALGNSFDPALVRQVGAAVASQAGEAGVGLLLAPSLRVIRSPLGGLNYASYSEDPLVCGTLAAAAVEGIQSQGVGACLCSFGAETQANRRFCADTRADSRTLHEILLEPFRIAVRSRPLAVLVSNSRLRGVPVGEDRRLIRDVLRGGYGFDGATVCRRAAGNRTASLRAGLDLEIPGLSREEIGPALSKGGLGRADFEGAALRVLDLLIRLRDLRALPRDRYTPERAARLARRASAESAVLLKNDGFLPLEDGKPFAVIGRMAAAPRIQCKGPACVRPLSVSGVPDELEKTGISCPYAEGYNPDGSTNDLLCAEARAAALEAGRAVIFCGLPDYTENGYRDRDSFSLPSGMLKLIDIVCASCPDTAVVLTGASPVALPFLPRVRALLWLNLGGQETAGAALDLLTGRTVPGGFLAASWPRSLSDLPSTRYFGKGRNIELREGVYTGYRFHSAAGVLPLFPFGFGLSYTGIRLDGVSCSRRTLGACETAVVTARVRNTGCREGFALVQVYAARKGRTMLRLCAFEKVPLFAGESRIVRLTLTADSFAHYNENLGRRCVEMGECLVYAGLSSTDLSEPMEVTVYPDESAEEPGYPDVQEILKVSGAAFAKRLGYIPEDIPARPYSLDSTLGDLSGRTVGKIALEAAENLLAQSADPPLYPAARRAMSDTPIRMLCDSGGIFSKSLAAAIVHLANYEVLRGISVVFKK